MTMDVCKYIIHLQLPRPSTRFLFGCFHAHAGDDGKLSTATMQAWEQRGVWLHDDAHNALSLAALPPLRADIPLRALLPMHGDRRTTAGREPLLSVYNVQHIPSTSSAWLSRPIRSSRPLYSACTSQLSAHP